MDDELIGLLEEASEYLDEEGRTSFRDANHVEALVGLIISKLDFPHSQYKLSGYTFERTLRSIIGQIDPEDDVEDVFADLLGELKKELGTSDEHEYSVLFSLPIKTPNEKHNKFSIEGIELEEITENYWERRLTEAKEDDFFRIHLVNSVYDMSYEGSYWKTTVSTLDSHFPVECTQFVLKTFLAEINFLQYYGIIKNFEIPTSNPWPNTWSDIRLPFLYLVFQDEEFVRGEFSEDTLPRKEVDIRNGVLDGIRDLPTFSEKKDVDDYLISGFHFYLSGITSSSNNASFLDFWRGLETLTLSEPGDSSSDITDRASSIIRNREKNLFPEQIDRVVDIRNNIVHGSTNLSVSHSDVNVLNNSMIIFLISILKNEIAGVFPTLSSFWTHAV